ncbi:MAG: cytochrome c biogenesis protein CcdA [Thermoplasmatota archaeon]
MKIRFSPRYKLLLSLFLILLLLILPTSIAVQPAPDFTVPTTSNDEFTLSEQQKPVVLEFMTPLCIQCREVEEILKDLHPEYGDEFTFLSIDIDGNSIDYLKDLKEDRTVPWELASDDADLFSTYQGTAVPMLIMIDPEGYITYEKRGVPSESELTEEFDKVLEGTAERSDLREYGIYTIAILGGFASFFSPCSFPLLPSYVAYYIRPDGENKDQTGLSMGIKASLGIVLVFGIIGVIAVSGGRWLAEYIPYLELIVGILILVLGIFVLTNIDIGGHLSKNLRKLKGQLKMNSSKSSKDSSPFLYGLGYGASSAGCTAPVFIAVILSSWLSQGLHGAIIVLLLYLITMSILMIIFSMLTVRFKNILQRKLSEASVWISRISGIVLVIAGSYLVYSFIML